MVHQLTAVLDENVCDLAPKPYPGLGTCLNDETTVKYIKKTIWRLTKYITPKGICSRR